MAEKESSEKKGERGKLLVVEDDAALSRGLKRELECRGFEVHVESRGTAALTYAAERSLDLVILDLRLPDMSGYEVCKKMRQISQPWLIPVLMLTAMGEPLDQLRGFAYGADAYLTKPYDTAELLKTISMLLGELPVNL